MRWKIIVQSVCQCATNIQFTLVLAKSI